MNDFSFSVCQLFSFSAFQNTLPPLVALGTRLDLGLEMRGDARSGNGWWGAVISNQ